MHLGVIGYGAIAQGIFEGLCEPAAPIVDRLTILVRPGRASETEAAIPRHVREEMDGIAVVESLDALLAAKPDTVAECAGQEAVRTHAGAILRAGIDLIAASVGALADSELYRALHGAAVEGGSKLVLPSGAIGGIDILAALRVGDENVRVTYRGSKPSSAWKGTPAEDLVDLDGLTEPAVFFSGNARDAASQYPKNANVAATLALAGAGFDATRVELTADPQGTANVHEFDIGSYAASVTIRIANRATAGSPKTSQATIFSMLRAIGNQDGPVVI